MTSFHLLGIIKQCFSQKCCREQNKRKSLEAILWMTESVKAQSRKIVFRLVCRVWMSVVGQAPHILLSCRSGDDVCYQAGSVCGDKH